MTKETRIEIRGKEFHVKCKEDEIPALQHAARYLEEKMHEMAKHTHALNPERLAIITALNITHQLLNIENNHLAQAQHIHERLQRLQLKLDEVHLDPK